MASKLRHPFHLVDNSPWPLMSSLFALSLTVRIVKLFYRGRTAPLFLSLTGLLLVSGQWWRDVSREATLLGDHSLVVELGIRWGIILFIVSEIFFFVSFFWAFLLESRAQSRVRVVMAPDRYHHVWPCGSAFIKQGGTFIFWSISDLGSPQNSLHKPFLRSVKAGSHDRTGTVFYMSSRARILRSPV